MFIYNYVNNPISRANYAVLPNTMDSTVYTILDDLCFILKRSHQDIKGSRDYRDHGHIRYSVHMVTA